MGIKTLEKHLAHYFGRNSVVLTRSGSFALITALHSANLRPGCKVVMPASCCPIVLFSIQMAGFKVVLADVSLMTLSMEVEHIEAVMEPDIEAIVAVHGYGHYCQIDEIADFAESHNLLLIEDACLAYGGEFKGKPLGSFGDISIISFGYDKPINNNYGGALMTNNDELYQKAEKFVNENEIARFSTCYHSDSISTALQNLSVSTSIRKQNIAFLNSNIENSLFVKPDYNSDLVYWRYPLFIEERERFFAQAKECNVVFTSHYKSLADLQSFVYLKNSKFIADNIINLFVHQAVPKTQLERMVEFINGYS